MQIRVVPRLPNLTYSLYSSNKAELICGSLFPRRLSLCSWITKFSVITSASLPLDMAANKPREEDPHKSGSVSGTS